MPRKKKVEESGKTATAMEVGLTHEEKPALAKKVPVTGPVSKATGPGGTDLRGNIDDHVTILAYDDFDYVVEDESHLSTTEKVGRLKQLIQEIRKFQLVIGLWVLLNVFGNDLADARSKNPKKANSFNAICQHPELPEELKGDTLRRYVMAAATMNELKAKGIQTCLLDYCHFREISKIPDESTREKVGREVVSRSLNIRETEELVQREIEKAKLREGKPASGASSESKISQLTEDIVFKLDHPSDYIIPDDEIKSVLLEPKRVRAEFNFREQAKIYEKAETVLKKKATNLTGLKNSLALVEADINFLENLMNAFDGEAVKAETD